MCPLNKDEDMGGEEEGGAESGRAKEGIFRSRAIWSCRERRNGARGAGMDFAMVMFCVAFKLLWVGWKWGREREPPMPP